MQEAGDSVAPAGNGETPISLRSKPIDERVDVPGRERRPVGLIVLSRPDQERVISAGKHRNRDVPILGFLKSLTQVPSGLSHRSKCVQLAEHRQHRTRYFLEGGHRVVAHLQLPARHNVVQLARRLRAGEPSLAARSLRRGLQLLPPRSARAGNVPFLVHVRDGFGDLGFSEPISTHLRRRLIGHLLIRWYSGARNINDECNISGQGRGQGRDDAAVTATVQPPSPWVDFAAALQVMNAGEGVRRFVSETLLSEVTTRTAYATLVVKQRCNSGACERVAVERL